GLNPNYHVTKTDGNLHINAKDASVAAENKGKTYGDDNPELTAMVTGTVNGDTLNYSLATTAVKFSGVGDYAITVTLGLNPNYHVTKTDGNLHINAKDASEAAENKGKTYGDDNPTLTATVTGTVNGDTLNYSLATTAAKFSSVGDYAITVTLGSNPNYNVSKTDGTLHVNPKALDITANNQSKTYGDTFTFTGTEFSSGAGGQLINGDNVTSVTLTSAGAAPTAAVAGSPYAITPSAAMGTGLGNYAISRQSEREGLTVNPKGLDITANDRTKTYGDTVTFGGTEFTIPAGQLVNGNTVTSVTLTSAGTVATATVAGSPYAITPSAAVGTGLGNYTISYHNATVGLTVNRAHLTVTAIDKSKTYNGASFTAFTVTITGFKNGETVAVVSGSATYTGSA